MVRLEIWANSAFWLPILVTVSRFPMKQIPPQALRGAINLFSNAYDNEDYSYAGLVAMAKFMSLEV